MIRSPRLAAGKLRQTNGQWSIELAPDANIASPESGAEVHVLLWDRSAASDVERVAHSQGLTIEEAAQGLSSRGALNAEGTNGAEAGALFLSRIVSEA